MKRCFVKSLSLPMIILILLGFLLQVSSVNATTSVTFTTGDMPVGPVFSARLDLRISVSTSFSMVFSGSSGSVDVDVSGDPATISVTYAGSMYSQSFTTPIGSLKIPIYQVVLGTIYAKVTGSVKVTPQVKGDASISPTTLSWTSSGSQSVSVAHKGSMFSFDTISIEMPFQYVLSIAIGIESLGTTLFEYTKNVGALNGTPIIAQGLSTISIPTIVTMVIITISAIGLVILKRKKPSQKLSTK